MRALEPRHLRLHGGVLRLHGLVALAAHEPQGVAVAGQALVGVVLPQYQTVFAARGHHAVGLVGAARHQVVDERAYIGLAAPQHEGRPALYLQRGVHAGHEALHGGLLIAARAVELPRAVEAGDLFRLQRGQQLQRVHAVVFDGVGRAGDLRALQPGYGMQHLHLHLLRHGAGKALDIELLRVQAHGLDEELVALLFGEGHHLGLDARAVARPCAGDAARIERRAVEVRADDVVRALVGVGEVAARAVHGRVRGGVGEALRLGVALLQLHAREVHAAGVHARRGARFEAPQRKPHLRQPPGEGDAGRQPVRPGVRLRLAGEGAAAQVGARADDGRAAAPARAVARHDRLHRAVRPQFHVHDLALY